MNQAGNVIIKVTDLGKVFKIPKKGQGLQGAIKALVKPSYTKKVAIDNLSFEISAGEAVGYIGMNGAGKSTTIKMLTGVLTPSSGSIEVLGRDPFKQRVANAKDIGVVFGQRTQLWWDIALIESLNLIAQIYNVPKDRFKTMLQEFSDILELDELLNKPIRTMSLGQKMRAELVATLIHEPKIVYLDEPTIGLDLIAKGRIRDFISQQNKNRQTTVMLTTHDLGDIEQLCQRIIIIDEGKLLYDGALDAIKNRFGKHRLATFELKNARAPEKINLPPHTQLVSQDSQKFTLRFDRNQSSASTVASFVMGQLEVKDFSIQEPNLEMIIKQIYQGDIDVSTN